jgi:hypothetical protein
MDGTSLYVNLRTGPGSSGLPPGSQPGDLLQWNGAEWVSRQPSAAIDDLRKFTDVYEGNVPVITVPALYQLISIVFAARAGYSGVAQLSAGITAGGAELFNGHAITGRDATYNPEGLTAISINQVLSLVGDTRVYITTAGISDTWAGLHFDLYIVLKPLK